MKKHRSKTTRKPPPAPKSAGAPSFTELSLKELLASAPLEGVDLTRPLDFGRDVDYLFDDLIATEE